MSQVGREILIKAVVQVIPTYTMSCLKLLVSLCIEIESLIRKFWWGQKCVFDIIYFSEIEIN